MSKHTPGPWQVIPPRIGAAITIYGADREFPVATTCSNTSPATMQAFYRANWGEMTPTGGIVQWEQS